MLRTSTALPPPLLLSLLLTLLLPLLPLPHLFRPLLSLRHHMSFPLIPVSTVPAVPVVPAVPLALSLSPLSLTLLTLSLLTLSLPLLSLPLLSLLLPLPPPPLSLATLSTSTTTSTAAPATTTTTTTTVVAISLIARFFFRIPPRHHPTPKERSALTPVTSFSVSFSTVISAKTRASFCRLLFCSL